MATYKIGEAASLLNLKTYVLRFWETEFPQVEPLRTEKGQRVYTDEHIAMLRRIRHLLHERGLTIEGARRALAEEAARAGGKGLAAGREYAEPPLFSDDLADEEAHAQEEQEEQEEPEEEGPVQAQLPGIQFTSPVPMSAAFEPGGEPWTATRAEAARDSAKVKELKEFLKAVEKELEELTNGLRGR